jgi:hypothetical protein
VSIHQYYNKSLQKQKSGLEVAKFRKVCCTCTRPLLFTFLFFNFFRVLLWRQVVLTTQRGNENNASPDTDGQESKFNAFSEFAKPMLPGIRSSRHSRQTGLLRQDSRRNSPGQNNIQFLLLWRRGQ